MAVELDAAVVPVVEKMRADFVLVAAQRVKAGDWDAADRSQASAAIKRVVEAGDTGAVLTWARWLASMVVGVLREWPAASPMSPRSCLDCRRFRQPNRADPMCAGRDDLACLYGPEHPFNHLPPDGAASCPAYADRGAS